MTDPAPTSPEQDGINLYSEKSLHIALKSWYAQPGDRFEVEVDGSVIDVVRDDLLIEIQTKNFSALKRKLTRLLDHHRVRVVHPVPQARWIVKLGADGKRQSRRKSPIKGSVYHVFSELVYVHHLMAHPNLSLDVLLVHEEEIRCNDGKGSWRRKGWSICDRRLLQVNESYGFATPQDLAELLPESLPEAFTTAHLAKAIGQRRRIAQQMTYCLKHMAMIEMVGKQGNAHVYTRL